MQPTPLKLIFAGTPEFAATALKALLHSPHQIIAVYTQPDRPAGRGLQVVASPVKQLAQEQGLPIFQPTSLKDPIEQQRISELQADAMIVAAYGLLLPAAVLAAPRLGCINIHASLLPHLRGAAPIQRAILEGDAQTGISIMQMDAGLDTGPVLFQASCPIAPTDTSETLHQQLAELGAQTLVTALEQLAHLTPQPQDPKQASHAAKITKEEGRITWGSSALEIDRKIRAFYPWPIAYTRFKGETLRIFAAEIGKEKCTATPGSILAASREGLLVATGEGSLRILRVQAPGGRALAIADFLNARQAEFSGNNHFE